MEVKVQRLNHLQCPIASCSLTLSLGIQERCPRGEELCTDFREEKVILRLRNCKRIPGKEKTRATEGQSASRQSGPFLLLSHSTLQFLPLLLSLTVFPLILLFWFWVFWGFLVLVLLWFGFDFGFVLPYSLFVPSRQPSVFLNYPSQPTPSTLPFHPGSTHCPDSGSDASACAQKDSFT